MIRRTRSQPDACRPLPPALRRPPLAAPGACLPPPAASAEHTVFEQLPHEIVCQVGRHIFENAVHDPVHEVESLDCNQAMRSILRAELHAGAVLRGIQAARDMPALCAALAQVQAVFPAYRHGCLAAAIHAMPRLHADGALPAAWWAGLEGVLPTLGLAPGQTDEGTDPREPLLLALVRALRMGPAGPHTADAIERVMRLIGREAPVGPRLAQALYGWVAQMIGAPRATRGPLQMPPRWESALPRELQQPLQRLFDFGEQLRISQSHPAESMARAMRLLDSAHAGGPDPRTPLSHLLPTAYFRWGLLASLSPQCKAQYNDFFDRQTPAEQLRIVQSLAPALEPKIVVAFLAGQIGRVPAATLLATLQASNTFEMASVSRECGALVKTLVEKSLGTPQAAEVLHRAITYQSIHDFQLGPFLAHCVDRFEGDERNALQLRLGIEHIGRWPFSSASGAACGALSQQVDGVLAVGTAHDRHSIETLAELHVGWLTLGQRCWLMHRLQVLPPATTARLLAGMVEQLAFPPLPRHPDLLLLTEAAVAACRLLPAAYQAQPLAALLTALGRTSRPAYAHLRRAVSDLHAALPTHLRPPLNPQLQDALLPPPAIATP